MNEIIKIVLLCFMFLNIGVFAQQKHLRFEHLSIEDGLSQASVYSILQDSLGFMWFGTEDGLNKYDGYKFTVYRHNPDDSTSLSNNDIRTFYEDSECNLWIGTYGGGLNKFNRKTEKCTHYRNQPNNFQSLSHNDVQSIYEDSGGSLWIGTSGGGLNKFNRKERKFTRYQNQEDNPQSLSHNNVQAIYEDSGGNLWIGTVDGLNKFDKKGKKFTRYKNQADNPHSLSHNNIRSIYEDSGGNLWIGTYGGGLNKLVLRGIDGSYRKEEKFIRYRNQPDNPQSLSNNYVWLIFQDSRGNLWIGTYGGGLNKFDSKEEKFIRYQNQPYNSQSLSHNTIYSIYEDVSENLWIGTYGGGLNIFDRKGDNFKYYKNQAGNPQSLSNNSVWSIYEDSGGSLWIGTWGGLNKFDRNKEKFTHYQNQPDNPQSLSNDFVWSIYEDSRSNLWIGTTDGLNKFDRKNEKFTCYQNQPDNPQSLSYNSIRKIYEDSGGNLWIGTRSGLNKFDRKNETFIHYKYQADNPQSLSHNHVLLIYEDSEGSLWIGTWGGLNKFDRKEEKFTRYLNQPDNPQSLSENAIWSIHEDARGSLWIGTSGGLNKFDRKEKRFTHYREKDGLPNDVVYGILEDDRGNLWLSTNKGISRFNPQMETFTNYDKKDGLQSNEFNAGAFHADRSGRMYFGGINGFNEFYPDSIKENTYIPPVVITDFLVLHKSVSVNDTSLLKQSINFTKEIVLNYTDNIFAFEFSALNYRQSEKNRFSYRLEGFNENWIDTDYQNRRAVFTNLSPGTYTFRVKASNDDGIWNEEGASVKITILPPFWMTWWFRSLAIAAFLTLVFVIFRLREKSIQQQQQQLELQVAERTEQLDDANKELKSFAYSVSHDLHAPVRGIDGWGKALEEDYGNILDEQAAAYLKHIRSETKKMDELIENLLKLSRISRSEMKHGNVDLSSIAQSVTWRLRNICKGRKIDFIIEPGLTAIGDKGLLETAMTNLFDNACKFTKLKNQAKIEFGKTNIDNKLVFFIRDNGAGFDMKYAKNLFGAFQRMHKSSEFPGTGIGLATVQRIIHRHGGHIWAEAAPDEGAVFYFSLSSSLNQEIN